MKSKVNELLEHVSKIENGSVTLPELEYSVELARDLYEKLVVVRHKVYEQGILEQPTFDLSPIAFEEEVSVDEQVVSDPVTIEINETVSEPEPTIFELESKAEHPAEPEIYFEHTAPEVELNLEEESNESNEELSFESSLVNEVEITDHSDDLERPMSEVQQPVASINNSAHSGIWIEKIRDVESHIPTSIIMSKLDTLIGSFGLNERLQFINELFGGSSETFSDAVKVLDARTGMDSAREKIAEFAAANNWEDADNETITDFVAKIKRRYA